MRSTEGAAGKALQGGRAWEHRCKGATPPQPAVDKGAQAGAVPKPGICMPGPCRLPQPLPYRTVDMMMTLRSWPWNSSTLPTWHVAGEAARGTWHVARGKSHAACASEFHLSQDGRYAAAVCASKQCACTHTQCVHSQLVSDRCCCALTLMLRDRLASCLRIFCTCTHAEDTSKEY